MGLRVVGSIISHAYLSVRLGQSQSDWLSLIRDFFSDTPNHMGKLYSKIESVFYKYQLMVLLNCLNDVSNCIQKNQNDDGIYMLNIGTKRSSGIPLCKENLPKLHTLISVVSDALRAVHIVCIR